MKYFAEQKGSIDKERITTDWQISYWAMKLCKSEGMIEDAIDMVGDNISDVRQYLFCGPATPVAVKTTLAPHKARRAQRVRQPIFDWLLSPTRYGRDPFQATG